jgi:hypothetical protein
MSTNKDKGKEDGKKTPSINSQENANDESPLSIQPEHIINELNKLSADNQMSDEQVLSFPIDSFPIAIQEIIKSTNECLNFPIDFIGSAILFSASVAIGNTHRIELKRKWHSNCVVYLALVGRPNSNKSHPLAFAIDPLYKKDAISHHDYINKLKEFEAYLQLTKKEKEEQDKIEKPILIKSIIGDITQETIVDIHQNNLRGIGVARDELASWFMNFDRYNKGSEEPFWLSNWTGAPLISDRKTAGNYYIAKPFISVIGTIQLGILNELGKHNRNQNGFVDRILFAAPDNLKKPYWNEKELDKSIYELWESIINRLFDLKLDLDELNQPNPKTIKYRKEAFDLLNKWQRLNTDVCNSMEDEVLSGILGKFDTHVIRLSLIIHLLKYGCNESDGHEISYDTTSSAIALVEYFQSNAKKVYEIIANQNPLSKFPQNKQALYDTLPDTFTTEQGIKIASQQNPPMIEVTFKRFIKTSELFKRLKQGEYKKIL